jgi:phosphatidylserine decarboxylase
MKTTFDSADISETVNGFSKSINLKESFESSAEVIGLLVERIKHDDALNRLLIASLNKAKLIAQEQLEPGLYKALQWPTDLVEYTDYLFKFSKWMPEESKDAIWKIPGVKGHQEVDDRLGHFHWLIDQKVGDADNKIVQNSTWFSKWLIGYAKCWGSFLDTTASFNSEKLNSFMKNSPQYKVEDSLINGKSNNPSGWLTFNQFFARELNPGLRDIESPEKNTIVTIPADCTFRAQYKIGSDSSIPEITIKKTHKFASIPHLLEGSKYKDAFADGTFVHYYLSPFSYHRFHTPVAGVIKECYPIHGLVYLDVNITDKQFCSPDNAEDGYQFAQARGVTIVDTTDSPYGNIGIVAVIPIGMCQVSSVNMIATVGSNALKGDEFGYFLFGGSDIIILFQKGANSQINTGEQYRHYGSKMAECRLLN